MCLLEFLEYSGILFSFWKTLGIILELCFLLRNSWNNRGIEFHFFFWKLLEYSWNFISFLETLGIIVEFLFPPWKLLELILEFYFLPGNSWNNPGILFSCWKLRIAMEFWIDVWRTPEMLTKIASHFFQNNYGRFCCSKL